MCLRNLILFYQRVDWIFKLSQTKNTIFGEFLISEFKMDQNIYLATQRLCGVYVFNGAFLGGMHPFNHETLIAVSYYGPIRSVYFHLGY